MRRLFVPVAVLLLVFTTLAFGGQAPPPWAEPVFNSLGAMPGMIEDQTGKVVVIGVAGDPAKLVEHGFKLDAGMPCKVRVFEIKKDFYNVEVKAMGQRGPGQVKELKLP